VDWRVIHVGEETFIPVCESLSLSLNQYDSLSQQVAIWLNDAKKNTRLLIRDTRAQQLVRYLFEISFAFRSHPIDAISLIASPRLKRKTRRVVSRRKKKCQPSFSVILDFSLFASVSRLVTDEGDDNFRNNPRFEISEL